MLMMGCGDSGRIEAPVARGSQSAISTPALSRWGGGESASSDCQATRDGQLARSGARAATAGPAAGATQLAATHGVRRAHHLAAAERRAGVRAIPAAAHLPHASASGCTASHDAVVLSAQLRAAQLHALRVDDARSFAAARRGNGAREERRWRADGDPLAAMALLRALPALQAAARASLLALQPMLRAPLPPLPRARHLRGARQLPLLPSLRALRGRGKHFRQRHVVLAVPHGARVGRAVLRGGSGVRRGRGHGLPVRVEPVSTGHRADDGGVSGGGGGAAARRGAAGLGPLRRAV
ncbi:hypothetical protein FGB62_257g013 [Gracilaria domingensis]|nr:hypothetical protein FGB62_257g013 [Gracilaria domingensis]